MAKYSLPVNIDTTYDDDANDPSRAVHQQHHDTLHALANRTENDGADIVTQTTGDTRYLWSQGRVVYDVTDATYGATGDGVTDDSTAVQAAVDAAEAAGGGTVFFPRGTYLLSSGLTVDADDVSLVGVPGASILRRAQDATWVVNVNGPGSGTAGSGFQAHGLTFDAQGSSGAATSAERGCLRVSDFSDVVIDNCRFSGAQNVSACRVTGDATTTYRRVRVLNSHVTNDCYETDTATSTVTAGVYFDGVAEDITVRSVTVTGAATNPIDIGVFVASGASGVVNDVVIADCTVTGLSRHGIGATDEAPTTSFRAGRFVVRDCTVKDCEEQGIKLKNVRRYIISGNYIEGCNTVPEAASTSLRGGIFVNLGSEAIVTDNVVINDGTMGIRVEGYESGAANGAGRKQRVFANNVIDSPTDEGILIAQRSQDMVVSGNSISNAGAAGILVTTDGNNLAETERYPRNIALVGNVITDAAERGIDVYYVYGISMTGNRVVRSGAFGVLVQNSEEVHLSGNVVLDSARSVPAEPHGIRINACDGYVVTGNRSGGYDYTSQTYGITFAGTPTNGTVSNNDFRGNATGVANGQSVVENWYGNRPVVTGSEFIYRDTTNDRVYIKNDDSEARLQSPTVDGETAFVITRRKSGALGVVRVYEGATDSGGSGYKVLRVPN